jgi:uncharacterized protein (TIGR03083 family)
VHPDEHLEAIQWEGAAFAAAIGDDLSAPVAACPGWTLETLVAHMGRVHRWATSIVRRGENTERPAFPEAPASVDRAWFEDGVDDLVRALTEAGPDEPAWTFGGMGAVRFWFRRQAQETAMHRWDAQSAGGDPGPIETELAIDGVDELLDQFLGPIRRFSGGEPAELGGTVHLHATDSPHGEWLVRTDGKDVLVGHGHEKGDAAVRATASDLLLWLWGRIPADDRTRIEVFGDDAIVARWHKVLPSP